MSIFLIGPALHTTSRSFVSGCKLLLEARVAYAFNLPSAVAGDLFTFTLDTDSVLVIRADERQIRAFHNVCTHRGTLLCEEERGNVRALVCPYHQWTFSRNGTLLRCAGMHEGIDKKALGLRPLHVKTCEGLIFVSFAETPPPFEGACEVMAPQARSQGLTRAKVAKVIFIPVLGRLHHNYQRAALIYDADSG